MVFKVDDQLLFHAEEIRTLILREYKDCSARLLTGLMAAEMLDGRWLYYDRLDVSKVNVVRNIGSKTINALRHLVEYLDSIVLEYQQNSFLMGKPADLEGSRRAEVIEKSNVLFANPNSIIAYHRYMEDMASVNASQIQSYAQFVIGIAESIIETQCKYIKEGKV